MFFCHLLTYYNLYILNLQNLYDISRTKKDDLTAVINTTNWDFLKHEIPCNDLISHYGLADGRHSNFLVQKHEREMI